LPQKTIFDESLPSMENMKSSLSFLELAVWCYFILIYP
jgi:hypothetical protein